MSSRFDDEKIKFAKGKKFDIQLDAGLVHERQLAEMFATARFEKIEAKHESWLWERTGNIAIEYRSRGEPSGIAATECDHWVHTLRNKDGDVHVHLVFPIGSLKRICRAA